jgi:hypothetical protein
MMTKWLLPLALAGAAACASANPTKPGVKLEARLPATFAQLSNVIELSDGRVAFADTRERLLLVGDLKSGKLDTLGARTDSMPAGAAPALYRFPGWLAHLGGDTIALVDFAALRTTLWNEKGEALSAVRMPDVAGHTPVLVYDRSGNGYKPDFTSIMGGAEPGVHPVLPDSIPLLRIQLATGRVDTVAHLAAPEYGDAIFGEQVQRVAKIFSPNDVFGVMPDGRLWIARGHENRVDWRGPGGVWIRGTSREYQQVPVTDADRERVIARVREQAQGHLPDSMRLAWPFAEHKPPFDAGMTSPDGEVWLQRPRSGDDAPMVYDVYGPDAAWKRAVAFPANVTLAGFGARGAIYGVIKEGDRRTVGRFSIN